MGHTPGKSQDAATDRGDTIPSAVRRGEPTLWLNPSVAPAAQALADLSIGQDDLGSAITDWKNFAPLLAELFPELEQSGGRIASNLLALSPEQSAEVTGPDGQDVPVVIKCDHLLPVAGSIKARGGFYEVLVLARALARKAGMDTSDSRVLASPEARALFANHKVMTGSTGNLGYAVGLIGRAMGFAAEVHMSVDARQWKKERLAAIGATVVAHPGDYARAVDNARRIAAADPQCYFVDDEDSKVLFLGYAAAAAEFAEQLAALPIHPTPEAPLVVHLPCGVGGAPGGIAFGLKHFLGDAVLPVFVEPVAAPCVLVQLASGRDQSTSVYDIGLTNRTEADGLAVPAASLLVCEQVGQLVHGVATVRDAQMFHWVARMAAQPGLRLEVSAAAGFASVRPVASSLTVRPCAHVVWTTGGGMMDDAQFEDVLARARAAAGSE